MPAPSAPTPASGSGFAGELRSTARLAGPIVLGTVAEMAITTTDIVLMGWAGPAVLAAGALGTNLYFMALPIGFGIGNAVAPMLAQAFGRRRYALRDARRTVRQGLWATTLAFLPVALALWHAEALLVAIGQQPSLAAEAGDYLRHMLWGILPYSWFMVLRSFLSARERPTAVVWITVAAIAFNALAGYALMFGRFGLPAWGLAGLGLSASLANLLLFALTAAFIVRDRRLRRYRLFGRFWRVDWPRLRMVLAIGMPLSLHMAFEVWVFSVAGLLMGLIGEQQLAAHTIAIQVTAISFMVPLGVSQAATVRVGLAVGRGDRGAVGHAGAAAFLLGVGAMAVAALLYLFAPVHIITLFLDSSGADAAVVTGHAVSFLAVAAAFQLVDGVQVVGGGVLRGLADTQVPMLIAGVGYWLIGLPVGAALAFIADFEGLGIWIGLAAGLAAVSLMLALRWSRREELGLVRMLQMTES